MQNRKPIQKYLSQYAEVETTFLTGLNIQNHDYCLVIPAYRENLGDILKVWQNIDVNVLIILIANAPSANDAETTKLIREIESSYISLAQRENLNLLQLSTDKSILLVDRCSHPIPKKQGVGLARKIGADISLSLIYSGKIKSPWIYNTDADVELPSDYFLAGNLKPIKNSNASPVKVETAALIYNFRHEAEPSDEQACKLYEASLIYYILGLRFANSKYAFSTIGSSMTVNAEKYALVRGFPKRNAGEDFYLLNKLAKLGQIQQVQNKPIKISGRLSERAPFGTGVGIGKILALETPDQDLLFYHPRCFELLQILLEKLYQSHRVEKLEQYFQSNTVAGEAIHAWCKAQNLFPLLASKQEQNSRVYYKFIDDWMDGFRTLKFIHFVRNEYIASLPWPELLESSILPKCNDADYEKFHKLLFDLY